MRDGNPDMDAGRGVGRGTGRGAFHAPSRPRQEVWGSFADRNPWRIGWTNPSGGKWIATLLCLPRMAPDESEIQVEDEFGIPDRVLCVGPIRQIFRRLTILELELIRRAARTRSGLLWLDARDGQLWWVQQEPSDTLRWRVTYSNHERVRTLGRHPGVSLALLRSRDHERLLDRSADGSERSDGIRRNQIFFSPPRGDARCP